MQFPKETRSINARDTEYGFSEANNPLVLDYYMHLEVIIIHNNNFNSCSSFILSNLPRLETLIVGDYSFRLELDNEDDSMFSIVNCPLLTEVTIGESFCFYSSFMIVGWERVWDLSIDCDRLQSLSIKTHKIETFRGVTELCLRSDSLLLIVTCRSPFPRTHLIWTKEL